MQENKSIILGGGISGLLEAYFNPDAILISDQIGGQLKSNFQLGPKYLHVDEISKQFFKELNIVPPIRKIKIGFFYDDDIHSENTEENRKRYFKKTRSLSSEPYVSSMSGNLSEFDSFDIDLEKIIDILKNRIKNQIVLEKITKINLNKKEIITEKNKYKYNDLISTIPLNVFLFLSNNSEIAKHFVSSPTTFIFSKSLEHCPFQNFQSFDYVYVSEPNFDFHRITKVPNGVVFEYNSDTIKTLKTEEDRVIMKVGQLIQNDVKIEIENVKFSGRYGSWKHNIKINNLLKQLYELHRK